MNKKGLSQIVSTTLIILITVAAVGVVGNFTRIFVQEKLDESQQCLELMDKIKINDEYTCYNLTRNIVHVSIIREDVDLTGITVGIRMEKDSFGFELTDLEKIIPLVQKYPSNETGVQMPPKEGSRTYIVEGIDSYPENIAIVPESGNSACKNGDTLEDIPVC